MKVVIASDKFKGSLSSNDVALAVEEGIKQVRPDCEIVKVAVADGGDGTAKTLVEAISGRWVDVSSIGPTGIPIDARYGIIHNDTVVIDIATASGLALLADSQKNPMLTTSIGTGIVIKKAIEDGYRKFIIGVGGSATNDAAMGLLSVLGFKFMDAEGQDMYPCGECLTKLVTIDKDNVMPELSECEFTILCDVDAHFYGQNGAAYLFGPQKGATDSMVTQLDNGLHNFANVVNCLYGKDIQKESYSGAAGGIAGGMWALLNAKLVNGTDDVLHLVGFEDVVSDADLVITGEGAMSRVSLIGKAPSGVCRIAAKYEVPTIAITGNVEDCDVLNDYGFLAVFPIVASPISLVQAISYEYAYQQVKRTICQLFRLLVYNFNK